MNPHEIQKPNVCYYHFPCLDGFGSALAVHMRWPDVELRPITYGKQLQDELWPVRKTVLFVDFFPGFSAIETMLDMGCEVTVLDHHKTAQAEAEQLIADGKIQGVFDMERSGAGITWDTVMGETRPAMINLIEDRDIWRFKYGELTKDFHTFLASYNYDFESWRRILEDTYMNELLQNMRKEGAAIRRKHMKDINEYIEQLLQWWWFDDERAMHYPSKELPPTGHGWIIPVLNIPYTHGSEACHELLRRFPKAPFAGYYVDVDGQRRWGFRSEDSRVDVSAVAKLRGGGGHRNASGFEEKPDEW